MTADKLVVATRNRGKLAEIAAILDMEGLRLLSLADWPGAPDTEESGATFRENAVLKAVNAARFTGLPALADDSGLCVDALGGAPGVMSASYGGPDLDDEGRYRLLLEAMRNVPDSQRSAKFVCVAALAMPSGEMRTALGELHGMIAREPMGDGGFGYDPVFFLPHRGCTLAQLPAEEKNVLSHRAIAVRAIVPHVRELLGGACSKACPR